ncbi:biofilm peroxide resistance protein BsmA [Erwinia sorbitola]|uniref:Biofilm peroxide resistance protein BsmA n=1 Tax=Erwinia sorbitola TaxID=2681984 RepID=A0A6I6EKJ8_9GAMM|nr:biofilm peroxide resistance protein BsmA [Erwinia sorbitola]MTD27592.1 biofilm peroxide resistance protein BsmA [Erwinia sorbitola]QGU89128.1 biofilm peroxide resistance protein BsmA [Erwinia sorbitola]
MLPIKRPITALLIALLLSSCSVLKSTPQPPPAPKAQAVEINRAQSGSLPRIGSASVTVRGSPDDAIRALAARANQAGARYYQILLVNETVAPGLWYASAIFYGASEGNNSGALGTPR